MKFEAKDIEELSIGPNYAWRGIIKNDGRFGLKYSGGIIMLNSFSSMFYDNMDLEDVYLFKKEEFVNEEEYQESKLIILKREGTIFENPINPHTGQTIKTPIPPKIEDMKAIMFNETLDEYNIRNMDDEETMKILKSRLRG